MSATSCSGETEEEGCLKVTPMLTFGPTSDVFPGMPKVRISSETDLIFKTSGGVEIEVVVQTVESVKMGEESGIKT